MGTAMTKGRSANVRCCIRARTTPRGHVTTIWPSQPKRDVKNNRLTGKSGQLLTKTVDNFVSMNRIGALKGQKHRPCAN